jgi:hypothetical protein
VQKGEESLKTATMKSLSSMLAGQEALNLGYMLIAFLQTEEARTQVICEEEALVGIPLTKSC